MSSRKVKQQSRRLPQDLSGSGKSETLSNANMVPHVQFQTYRIRRREGESTKDFVRRFRVESRDVKGAPEIIRILGFIHGIINPELIKRLHDKIPKSVDEIIRITTSFLRGEVAAGNQERKKSLPLWKQQEDGHRQNFKKGVFKNQQRSKRRQGMFTLLSKSTKEILALEKGKFKAPPPMITQVKKRNSNKFFEFHGEMGHNTDECMHLKRQIEELLKNGKLLHPWQRLARQKITQSFSLNLEILFLPLEEEGTEGPMIIEAEIRGHFIHRMYVDGGPASEILYEHCFNGLRPEIRNQMVSATAS
nr:reverse transcriptase domain-containing protein [Tanacetum cinerariifolium]